MYVCLLFVFVKLVICQKIWSQNLNSFYTTSIFISHLSVLRNLRFHIFAHRETPQSSPAADKDALVATSQKSPFRDLGTDSKRDTKTDNKADHRSPSPHGKRTSPITVREPGSHYPPKPPRLSPSPTPSISPLLKRRKAEAGRTSPALKLNIPTILLEDEPMETECAADRSNEGSKTRRKEGKVRKSKKGRSAQPRSPEEGRMMIVDELLCKNLN